MWAVAYVKRADHNRADSRRAPIRAALVEVYNKVGALEIDFVCKIFLSNECPSRKRLGLIVFNERREHDLSAMLTERI
jgi:hypothetical protein